MVGGISNTSGNNDLMISPVYGESVAVTRGSSWNNGRKMQRDLGKIYY